MAIPGLLQSQLAEVTPKREIEAVCNGCGFKPVHKILDWIMGINVRQACCLHDFEYFHRTLPRAVADYYFYVNLKNLIQKAKLNSWREVIALQTAYVYYFTVRSFGGFVWNS